ncbi:hypothetical protein BHM03_00054851 [Ensete ventricosum]|nr:hypothetical protein BHM03_00054851 [Ensete ventricosum]
MVEHVPKSCYSGEKKCHHGGEVCLTCAEGGSGGSVADATDDAQLTPRYSELYRTASHGGEPDGLAHVVSSI